MKKVNVLDKGYVVLHGVLGNDATAANAARVSYNKQTQLEDGQLAQRDRKLTEFLAREGHTSPFRHAVVQLEVYAPLMVARQWWKHIVGSRYDEHRDYEPLTAWNESSRRYITEECEFYIVPHDEWRLAPQNSKQGSAGLLDEEAGRKWTKRLMNHAKDSEALYEEAMNEGICAEQARLFLPAYSLYVRLYWTTSLQAVAHFINLRQDSHAQKEIQDYALAVKELVAEQFPVSLPLLTDK